jgi:hypothetical protein
MLKYTDNEFSLKLDQNYGINITFHDQENEFLTIYEGPTPRKVILDVTTWKGMTPGAMHYYGQLKISSLTAKKCTSGDILQLPQSAPTEAKGMQIQLTRPLRRKDLRIDAGERFKGAKIGDKIKNFDSKKDIEEAAIEFFKKNFHMAGVSSP